MKAYLIVSLCLNSLVLLITIVELATQTFPKARKPETIGVKCAGAIVGLGFICWAAILLSR